jgi:Na+/proline symporter
MGGMRTVIWTDVMQFLLFTFGGLFALSWISNSIDGGWSAIWNTATNAGKTKTWDATFGVGSELQFTFWVAVIAVPFQNLTAFGVDQLNAQRMFCCKNAGDARKAIIWSSVGQALTYLMLLVGAALFAFYYLNPPTGDIAQTLAFGKGGVPMPLSEGGVPADGDLVFPVWIVTQLPAGLAGLILAGVFAAAISSLDSILAALSQTTISLIHNPENQNDLDQARLVKESRKWVVIWGLTLTVFTILMNIVKEKLDVPILPLAFGMTSYTMGPLLGMFLCALIGRGDFRGILLGACLSFVLTMFVRMDIWILVKMVTGGVDWLAALPTYELNESGKAIPLVGYFWMWPIGTLLTFGGGLIGSKMKH